MQGRLALRGGELATEDEDRIEEALAAGAVIAYPTETYYGLGASPWDEEPVERVLRLKGERGAKPISLVLATTASVLRVAGEVPPTLELLARRFWPGPLTAILRARPDLPAGITAGSGTVAVRVPGHSVARGIARLAGGAVTATSANPAGLAPPRTADEVQSYFLACLDSDLALLVDGGQTRGGPASTILDLTVHPARVVRPGAVSRAEVESVVSLEPPPGEG